MKYKNRYYKTYIHGLKVDFEESIKRYDKAKKHYDRMRKATPIVEYLADSLVPLWWFTYSEKIAAQWAREYVESYFEKCASLCPIGEIDSKMSRPTLHSYLNYTRSELRREAFINYAIKRADKNYNVSGLT